MAHFFKKKLVPNPRRSRMRFNLLIGLFESFIATAGPIYFGSKTCCPNYLYISLSSSHQDKEHTKKNPSYVGTQFSVARCWNQKVAQFFEKLVQKVATAVFLSK